MSVICLEEACNSSHLDVWVWTAGVILFPCSIFICGTRSSLKIQLIIVSPVLSGKEKPMPGIYLGTCENLVLSVNLLTSCA